MVRAGIQQDKVRAESPGGPGAASVRGLSVPPGPAQVKGAQISARRVPVLMAPSRACPERLFYKTDSLPTPVLEV